jgi:murein DD-endopeptidase MepM/ murein hydrolase activator NlpD
MSKRIKTLSVLFIPDGERQTISLKIRYNVLKVLFALFIIVCLFIIIASLSYWKLTKIAWDYEQLKTTNQNLLKNSFIINDIADRFNSIEELETRIRSLFGDKVEFPNENAASTLTKLLGSSNAPPYSRESLSRALNPFLRADVISSYPTYKPVSGDITQYFSLKNERSETKHLGVDITAPEGTVIYAAGDGVVIFSNWTVDAGNQIIIDHQNGYCTVYKHISALIAHEREFVYQGKPIALVGNSGVSTAPHLHFEVWKQFVPIDPLTFWTSK